MSLFPSSFEGSAAGPSKSITTAFSNKSTKNNNNKRKRPSVGAHHDEGLLKSTQANLEKLMNKLEKGELTEKAGTENMGLSSKKKKAKSNNHELPKAKAGVDTPNKQHNRMKESTPNLNKNNKNKLTPKKAENSPQERKKDKSKPVELPIQTIPTSEGKLKVGGEGLTDMQSKMQAKLEGARFRWINEQLYSTPSTEAVEMMKKDPKIFADYHMTHRALTAGWPAPPLQYITKALSPLPSGTVIADLGCGDAGLARALVPQGKVVLSYDLVGDSGVPGSGSEDAKKVSEGWVIQADFLEQIPLPGRPGGLNTQDTIQSDNKKGKRKGGKRDDKASEIVDVAVCCLSLMGKNWVGGIAEVCRILKQGGTFHVAEVTSRFTSTEEFVEKVESFGFKLEEQDSPSTHFTLFRFTKETAVPLGPARGEEGWEDRVYEGEEILKACVYKKR
ncbi:uncharacterized protein I206_104779 [Kwoniella pini CBS 10737]|uniref:Ribosomal RNA-processing protein 8 n=1 Tax=Kwoniella pini CBS 10737 TaxID=1296096 RepID=A0A1B9I7X2_9TREE|nr:uncharacterized protein I206_02318 [Kwoniella pini CBS 10737]OCF51603.1 hypothetical protein I206_02318 [Kwoniella pini CBS 10737]